MTEHIYLDAIRPQLNNLADVAEKMLSPGDDPRYQVGEAEEICMVDCRLIRYLGPDDSSAIDSPFRMAPGDSCKIDELRLALALHTASCEGLAVASLTRITQRTANADKSTDTAVRQHVHRDKLVLTRDAGGRLCAERHNSHKTYFVTHLPCYDEGWRVSEHSQRDGPASLNVVLKTLTVMESHITNYCPSS